MKGLLILTKRNIKLFFKDKGMFFTSLITPGILLLLYSTFLGKVYKDSFLMSIPEGFKVSDAIVNGLVGSQLISSLLAVSCITVAFCSNMLMAQDKTNGTICDFTISPVKPSVMAISYYIAAFVSTLIVSLAAMGFCFIYLAFAGWYMSVLDVLLMIVDVILLVMFGTAISSVINFFLSSQGQISAVGTIVSAAYGFICGAYMPISQLTEGIKKAIMFLPGTYGTSLIKNHAMRGVLAEMSDVGFPDEVIEGIKDSIDCNIYFFENKVDVPWLFSVMIISILVIIMIYVLMNMIKYRKSSRKTK